MLFGLEDMTLWGGKRFCFFFFNQEKAQVGFLQFKFSNNLTKGRESVPFFDAK